MSALERYKEAKARYEKLKSFAKDAASKNHCDKFRATVKLTDTSKGYYGNSSVSTWDDYVIRAMEHEIQGKLREFAQLCAETAKAEMIKAAQQARDEALEVVGLTNEVEE